MKNYQKIIAGLLGSKLIAYNADLAKALKDIPSAVFLNQLLYWWRKGKYPEKIWKTDEDFYKECGLTSEQCKRIRKKLQSLGLITVKKEGLPAKNFYYIHLEKIEELIASLTSEWESPSQESGNPTDKREGNPLTNTKNTTENTYKDYNNKEEQYSKIFCQEQVPDRSSSPPLNSEYKQFEKEIVEEWNKLSQKYPVIPCVKVIGSDRRRHLKQRFTNKEFVKHYKEALAKIPEYKFLLGENPRRWVANFDWFIRNDSNWAKILEGKYKEVLTEADKRRRAKEIMRRVFGNG